MRTSFFLLIAIAGCWVGCSTRNAEYYRVWDATHKVLARNNLVVRDSGYREDTIVAVSKVHGDFLSKSRVKVVARVVEDQHGYWEPHIRVLNQWDNSDARTWGHPDYQPHSQWINLSVNAAMEAQLYNEIQEELGHYNPYAGKAWQPPYKEDSYSVSPSASPVPLTPYE